MLARSTHLVTGLLVAMALAGCSAAPVSPPSVPPPAPASPTTASTTTNHLDETWAPVTDTESGVTMSLPGPTNQVPLERDGLTGTNYITANTSGPAVSLSVLRIPDGFQADLTGGIERIAAGMQGQVLSSGDIPFNGHPARQGLLTLAGGRGGFATLMIAMPTRQVVVTAAGPDRNVVEALHKRAVESLRVPAA